MTTPAIRALKESLPGRRITLLTSAAGASIAAMVPEIDEIIRFNSAWMKATAPGAAPDEDFKLIDTLRGRSFDGAVLFTVFSQNPLPAAYLCFLAGIPRRLAHCRENPYQLLTHWVSEPEPARGIRHEVRRQLDLVATVGCTTTDDRLSLVPPPAACEASAAALAALGISGPRWLLMHPGASAPSRRYPAASFAQAAHTLAREHGFQVVFTGSPDEQPLVESIRATMDAPSFSLCGTLSLPELAGLIAHAPLLITNNTGPAHIAAAVGTPVVDLYALTNPQHTPWRVRHKLLFNEVSCKNCFKSVCPEKHHRCLTGVLPDEVVRAALDLFAPSLESLTPSATSEPEYAHSWYQCSIP